MGDPVDEQLRLVRAARRAVEMVRWWPGAPAQLMPAWSALQAKLAEGRDVAAAAGDLAGAVEDRSGWPPDERAVMDALAAAVDACAGQEVRDA